MTRPSNREEQRDKKMPTSNANLLLRNDTVLGVCEAIGQDFGFHPNWLRLTLASLFYFFPMGVIGTYLGLGVVVALTRWIAPDGAETVGQDPTVGLQDQVEPLRIAA
jgi:phage shock protein C